MILESQFLHTELDHDSVCEVYNDFTINWLIFSEFLNTRLIYFFILQRVRILIRIALVFEKNITDRSRIDDSRRKSFGEILTRLGSRENSSSSLQSLPVFNKSFYNKTVRNNEKNSSLEKLLNIPSSDRYQPEIEKITAFLDLKFRDYNGSWASFSKSLKHRLCKVASYQYTPNQNWAKI